MPKEWMELNSIIAESRVMREISRAIPPEEDHIYKPGDKVLVLSENDKQWTGPIIVVKIMVDMIPIVGKEGDIRHTFSSFRIKQFYEEIEKKYDQMKWWEAP